MRPPEFFSEHNARHFWHPMAHPAEMQSHPPKVIASAEGVHVTDVDGHRVLDAVGGLWNVNLGFSNQAIKDAMRDQLERMPYYSAFRGTSNTAAVELSLILREWFEPDGLTRAFFSSGGSDAVETALRLARQYHRVRGQLDRTKFISLKQGYHGTHFGGASVNGNAKFRRNYEPMLPGCFHIPAPWTYRNPFDEQDPARLAELCAGLLDAEIRFQSPDTVAAFIMEPVLGAGGVIPPHESFMPMVREICNRHGVLLIADEVITAFGRTGAWTGSRLWGVQPDLMCTAKGITNGYFPFGATMISEKVAAAFEGNKDGFGAIGHGYTYSAHPVGAAAAIATLAETERLQVAENARHRGKELIAACRGMQDRQEIIGDVRGQGLMVCLELVSDRDNKTPMDKKRVDAIFEQAYADGVMIRVSGNNVILSPSLIVTDGNIRTIAETIEAAIRKTA
ncbi:MAG: aminotransferase class III-fold pyridoxal phosphate-dependent enzyme [Gammaproteobacteria bacterium]|nr:aminotransferase class III-fold pyridoxal phosphate-dependent enzyme [Gammaproteobacteria bacterium]